MYFAKKFYELINAKCAEYGDQGKFAAAAGISQHSLSKILSGRTKDPGLSTVSALVDAIGIESFLGLPPADRPDLQRELAEAREEIDRLKSELKDARIRVETYKSSLEIVSGQNRQEKSWNPNSSLDDQANAG